MQNWRSSVMERSKDLYYKQLFEDTWSFENYFLLAKNVCYPILQFRTDNHNLPIETGRWFNIPSVERVCKLRNSPALRHDNGRKGNVLTTGDNMKCVHSFKFVLTRYVHAIVALRYNPNGQCGENLVYGGYEFREDDSVYWGRYIKTCLMQHPTPIAV